MSSTQLPSLWNHQTESVTATRRAFAHYCRPLFVSPTSWQWFQRLHCAGTYRVPLQQIPLVRGHEFGRVHKKLHGAA